MSITVKVAPIYLTESITCQANILIDETGRAHLADFGLLTIISNPKYLLSSSSHTQGGTVRWMSPERIAPQQFGFKSSRPTVASDCYALGMVVYEIISGNLPFHKDIDITVSMKVVGGEHPSRGVRFTESLWRMLEMCWEPQPNNRPSIEGVLQCLEVVSSLLEPPSPGVGDEVGEGDEDNGDDEDEDGDNDEDDNVDWDSTERSSAAHSGSEDRGDESDEFTPERRKVARPSERMKAGTLERVGSKQEGKGTKCDLCGKRLGRATDLPRHKAYCEANPERAARRTPCKICGKILSGTLQLFSVRVLLVTRDP